MSVFVRSISWEVVPLTSIDHPQLHLTGALHMAGVPGLVSRYPPISEEHGPEMAKALYETPEADHGVIDVLRSARALHTATELMRRRGILV